MATAMFAFFVASAAAVLTSRRPPATGARNRAAAPVAALEAPTKESIP